MYNTPTRRSCQWHETLLPRCAWPYMGGHGGLGVHGSLSLKHMQIPGTETAPGLHVHYCRYALLSLDTAFGHRKAEQRESAGPCRFPRAL